MWIVKAANGERLLNITSDKVLKLFRTARDRILNIYCVIELKFYLINGDAHLWTKQTTNTIFLAWKTGLIHRNGSNLKLVQHISTVWMEIH